MTTTHQAKDGYMRIICPDGACIYAAGAIARHFLSGQLAMKRARDLVIAHDDGELVVIEEAA